MGAAASAELEPSWELLMNVVQFLPWEDRKKVGALSQQFRSLMGSESTFRVLCGYLEEEHFIFVPKSPLNGSWKLSFLHLFPFTQFSPHNSFTHSDADEKRNFVVQVYARFREGACEEDKGASCKATIPLHQRTSMLRAQHKCDPKEALRLLWGGAGSSHDPWKDAYLPEMSVEDAANATNKENACGVRSPKSSSTGVTDASAKVGVLSIRPTKVVVCAPSLGVRAFNFQQAFPPSCPQEDVYTHSARYVVADFVNGINGCIMCYGQTGSGKTFTMFGPTDRESTSLGISHLSGLAPRMLTDILQGVHLRASSGSQVRLALAYVEVFGNDINDLLRDGALIGPWHGVAVRHVMQGLASVEVTSQRDIEELLRRGESVKRRAATAMNERSSRAHSVMMLTLQQTHANGQMVSTRLCIADLGGSEQVKKSQVAGAQMAEAVNINLGLLALKSCMTALRRQRSHVPFNDSTLTMLLSDALSGSSNVAVVVTGSLHPSHTAETVNTLRFGETCGKVEHEGVLETAQASDAIAAINQELAELEDEIRRVERWETRAVVRPDLEGSETMMVTVPVGAEDQRAKFESLLATRRELLGM